jgi:CBS domain-containing protein
MEREETSSVARDLMTPSPARVSTTSTVGQALRLLRELDVRHLPVINEGRELVGMVSDRDFRGLPLANVISEGGVSLEEPISEMMSSDVISVGTDASLDEIIELMLEFKVGALPVVDADDLLVGIVSYIDILRFFQKWLEHGKEEVG